MEFVFDDPEEEDEYIVFSEDEDEELEVDGIAFSFESTVPERKTIADPEVQKKAQTTRKTRKRKPENKDYAGKRAEGWSYCCAHKDHLSNLCERYQNNGEITCSCPCHKARGYVLTQPDSLSTSDEEEYILLFD